MLSCHVRDEVILRLLQNEIFIFFQRDWSVVFLKYVRNIDFFKLIKFYQRDSGVQQYFFSLCYNLKVRIDLFIYSESVSGGVLWKKVFLKIL